VLTAQEPGIVSQKVESASPVAPAAAKPPARMVSLDIYRGFVMMLMASDGLYLWKCVRDESMKNSAFWQFLGRQTDHVPWTGCVLWDLIQPSFMFMVGVSMPYSLASRRAKGDSFSSMFLHAISRSLILIALAIFLSSVWDKSTQFIFTNVLAQIGLGYTFLFLLAWTKPRTQIIAACGILLAHWAAYALYPLPPADFDYSTVGGKLYGGAPWEPLTGFAAHWNKNTNLNWAFDQWFMPLFPRDKPWTFNNGGYGTLNFVSALVTMIFGLIAGQFLRTDTPAMKKFQSFIVAGLACLAVGWTLDATGICPSIKRLWTPSWAIFSTGWTCLMLGVFYYIVDIKGYQRWAFPLLVVGMNSIAMYCMAHLWPPFIKSFFRTHLGQNFFDLCGKPFVPAMEAAVVLVVMWCVCWWMYRRKLFLRI
jgi:heparan-alpha-glucosaminide N-acetyltransferase